MKKKRKNGHFCVFGVSFGIISHERLLRFDRHSLSELDCESMISIKKIQGNTDINRLSPLLYFIRHMRSSIYILENAWLILTVVAPDKPKLMDLKDSYSQNTNHHLN